MTISNEAIEAAAKAYRGEFPYDENEGYVVKLILEAAAGIIRAEALEASAETIDEDPYDDLDPFYAGWLRNRAEKIREGE